MLAKIRSNQIHQFTQQLVDAEGKAANKDIIQLDVNFPEYPELPTYGITVDYPATKEDVIKAVKTLAVQAKAQMEKDAIIRKLLENTLEFEVEV
jgi:hypothetical protein